MSDLKTPQSATSWGSVLQIVLTGFAALFSWGAAALAFFGGVLGLFSPSDDPYAVATSFSLFLAGGLVGCLFLIPVYFAAMRLSGRSVEFGSRWRKLRTWFHPKRLLILFPVLLLIGYLADNSALSRDLVLPFINVLLLGIPVAVFTWLAVRRLPKGSYQLGWGAFSLGLAIGPTAVLFLEILAIIFIIIVLVFTASTDPALGELFSEFSSIDFEIVDPYLLDRLIGEVINTPKVLGAVLVFLAGFVPVIEELLKPISVWVLLGRKLRPEDGWVIGVLSGAGFALFENFGNASVSPDWIPGIISRAAATIPHVFTAGLMGYTLALARSQKRWGRLVLIFGVVVVLHGAWNAAYVLSAAASLAPPDGPLSPKWAPVFLAAVGILAVGMLVATLQINRKLHRECAQHTGVRVPDTALLDSKQEHGS